MADADRQSPLPEGAAEGRKAPQAAAPHDGPPPPPAPRGETPATGEGPQPTETPRPDSPYSGRPDWQGKLLEVRPDGLPAPLKWRPVFMWRALAFGFVFDLAAEVLLQQLGKQLLTVYSFFHAAVVGAIVGLVAPSIGRAVGVWWANRTLREARTTAPPGRGGNP